MNNEEQQEEIRRRNKWIEGIVISLHNETRQPYKLGGTDDPHFQDHGGNVLPDRVEANEDFCDMHQELRDEGRSDGYGESYSERNT